MRHAARPPAQNFKAEVLGGAEGGAPPGGLPLCLFGGGDRGVLPQMSRASTMTPSL